MTSGVEGKLTFFSPGVAFTNIGGDQNSAPSLYPTVGLQTHKGVIEANFGHKKFVFDIEDYFMVTSVSRRQ